LHYGLCADAAIRFYATFVSRLHCTKFSISRILGHSDLGVTFRVHAHRDPQRARASAGRIDVALNRRLVDSAAG
jgi:hypothetical protein